ncbi:hypothetical protein ACVBEH_04895 [Roseateles sp. GG27B]
MALLLSRPHSAEAQLTSTRYAKSKMHVSLRRAKKTLTLVVSTSKPMSNDVSGPQTCEQQSFDTTKPTGRTRRT